MIELQEFLKTTVNGGLDARNLVTELIAKAKLPPVLEVTACVEGVTCKLELGVTVMVPGPVTTMLTVALLAPFFRTETAPTLALIVPPGHVATGGTVVVVVVVVLQRLISGGCGREPVTTADDNTSALALTGLGVAAAGVVRVESIVISPDPAN